MKDEEKTKEQLVEELEAMRRQVAGLESKVAGLQDRLKIGPQRWVERAVRVGLDTSIRLTPAFETLRARGINLSEGGICFEVSDSIPFRIEFRVKEEHYDRRARLIWVKHIPKGGYRFGLKFLGT